MMTMLVTIVVLQAVMLVGVAWTVGYLRRLEKAAQKRRPIQASSRGTPDGEARTGVQTVQGRGLWQLTPKVGKKS